MHEQAFIGTVRAGHKEHAVELPFDPVAVWQRAPERFAQGRRGIAVVGHLQGVAFTSHVVSRSGKRWLLLPLDAELAAGVGVGATVSVSVGVADVGAGKRQGAGAISPVMASGPVSRTRSGPRAPRGMPPRIRPFRPQDRAAWQVLAQGYKEFYATPTSDAEYDTAWHRLLAQDGVHGLGAFADDRLVGIAHYLFHTSVWAETTCYLQDLFTLPGARGAGVGRALIEAVALAARARSAARYYWLTQEHNAVARVLYDKVARYAGFIRYDFPLQRPGT